METATTWPSYSGLVCASLLALTGCPNGDPRADGGTEGVCSTLPGQELQVGTAPPSGEGFLAFEDGDDVQLATGGQGGYHVFVNYAVRGFDPFGLTVRRAVSFAANGMEITRSPEMLNLRLPAEPGEDTYCTLRTAQWAILCPFPFGRIEEAELELEVDLRDQNGETALVTRYLRAVCPPDEERDEEGRTPCNRICDGIPVDCGGRGGTCTDGDECAPGTVPDSGACVDGGTCCVPEEG